jgi:3-hydroxyisobutyrate dehydrogenase-like beta-hydroxyacid dehydrogenase
MQDMRLALEVAAEHRLDLPLVRRASERYEEARSRGWGDLDYSVVARVDARSSGSKPSPGGAHR